MLGFDAATTVAIAVAVMHVGFACAQSGAPTRAHSFTTVGGEIRSGLLGMTLRYPYEVRNEKDYFDDIADEKIPKDMLELAQHIVKSKAGHFHPEKFEDQYEDALKELLKKKQAGEKIDAPREPTSAKVVNLMDALRRSVEAEVGVARGGRLNGERQRGIKPQRRRSARKRAS